ncbi:hypothetical protein [Pseudomonas poae]|uniref:hypothetical protein n=1 Tax=Pseudomonas poae TaxID=200451 RepID=UPI0030E59930
MTQTLDLIEVVVPLTETQLQAGLLDLSGDLDKAAVLRTQLPPWMVTADADVLAALEQAHRASERPRARLNALLERLRPLMNTAPSACTRTWRARAWTASTCSMMCSKCPGTPSEASCRI